MQPLLKRTARRRAVGGRCAAKAALLAAAVQAVAALITAGPALRARRAAAKSIAAGGGSGRRTADADGAAATGAAEAVQRAGNVIGQRIFDRDDFGDVFRRHGHVHPVNHLQHPFHVFRVVADHENAVAVNRQDGICQFGERRRIGTISLGLMYFNCTMWVT